MVADRYCILNLPNKEYRYPLQTWLKLCKANSLSIIPFSQIKLAKPQSFVRYHLCDPRFPCILYKKPNNKYLVIDGNHRIQRQIDKGESTGIFFIITPKELNEYHKNQSHRRTVSGISKISSST